MTDQELRKLRRSELLEIMIAQSKKIDQLQKKLNAAERKLADKKILLEKTGNIAEAALQLNHIFEDAQEAAEQYLANVRRRAIEIYGEAALQMDPDYVSEEDHPAPARGQLQHPPRPDPLPAEPDQDPGALPVDLHPTFILTEDRRDERK